MNLISGKKVVASAGTPLQLVATTSATSFAKRLVITPFSANTGVVAIGGSAATTVANATIGQQQGVNMLKQSTPLELYDVDLTQVWVDASVNGEGVSWAAEY